MCFCTSSSITEQAIVVAGNLFSLASAQKTHVATAHNTCWECSKTHVLLQLLFHHGPSHSGGWHPVQPGRCPQTHVATVHNMCCKCPKKHDVLLQLLFHHGPSHSGGWQLVQPGSSSSITDQATVVAGNLFNLAGICQVCPSCIRVYDGLTPIQDMHVEELLLGAPAASVTIVSGQIADPFVLLRLSNGQAVLLVGDEFSMTLSLCTTAAIPLYARPSSNPFDLVTAACLYE
ncbi:hypothetical protein DUNSADRAFT_5065, partial [Dunaliella salina]